MLSIVLGIAGAFISWIITHSYHVAAKKSQTKNNVILSQRLSFEVQRLLIEENSNNLSIIQLNELLESKIHDETAHPNDPLPFKACPKCGSASLSKSSHIDESRDEMHYAIKCYQCNWNEWTQ